MNAHKHTFRKALPLVAAGLALGLATTAHGQSSRRDFNRPLRAAAGVQDEGAQAKSILILNQVEGDKNYQIRIEDDKTEATVNGQPVPPERIRRSGEQIEILDEHGQPLTTFDVQIGGGADVLRLFHRNEALRSVIQGQGTQPRVMIGVTMVDPTPELLEHLDLEAGTAVEVDRVVDGLPADKAGLKARDVIVEVDGVRPVTPAKIRELLASKKPGDSVPLTVMRKGEEVKLTIELAEFDPARLAPQAMQFRMQGDEALKRMTEARKRQEEVMKDFDRYYSRGLMMAPDGDRFRVFAPQPPQTPETRQRLQELDNRMAELDEKMARLDAQLLRLEKALERLERTGTQD